MSRSASRHLVKLASLVLLPSLLAVELNAQLVWDQSMDQYSVVLPLTLDNNVYRVRAKPPEGVAPRDIACDIGITGTVLTDQRGTSSVERGEKVVGNLWNYDDIDVQFADRVHTGNRDYVGNRGIQKYDFDCGINIKYKTLQKVAQVEIRLGYVLPSGDIEGLTWSKIRRKQRILRRQIAKCERCRREIADLQNEQRRLAGSGGNSAQQALSKYDLGRLSTKIKSRQRTISHEAEFHRDLAAFASLNEYLKTKIHGTQVYVHFHYQGKTLPADLDNLKRSRIRPIQVFEYSKDPIRARVAEALN